MPLALVIPIERPVDASQLPASPGSPSHQPAPTPPASPSQPIYFPGSPDQGLPPVLAFPSHDLPTGGAHPSNELPDPRRPHIGGGPAPQPGRPPQASQLPAGIRVIKPPIYIEGNPPLVGWELPEHPSTKPSPKPPEEAQPKK